MYSYVSLPGGDASWAALRQPLTYACVPAPLLLPSIQAHNFCSRPAGLRAGAWAAPREYHRFYTTGVAVAPSPPWGAFPAAPRGPPLLAAGAPGPAQQGPAAEGCAPWPEGASLQAELRWGRVERARGPGLRLPDPVRRALRRAYGTYPRTDVRVTRRRGEFLVRAAPRVGEPEYRVERRVVRRPASSDSSGGSTPARESGGRGRLGERKVRAGRAARPGPRPR
ncbi:uncharacterized protein C10orf95 homolog [Ctenodactylus gundi]